MSVYSNNMPLLHHYYINRRFRKEKNDFENSNNDNDNDNDE